ncbi:AAA family ATPase [Pelagibacterium sp.]|uniref:AAA family ATPase n=1 Tax=Pelagibacterium sp. TaxID=1967288 RepID=UPI003A9535C6
MVHLDQLRHVPGSNWQPRSDEDFATLHDAAIAEPAWIMDGSYSALMPQRILRATAIIVLDENLFIRTLRYLKRSLSVTPRKGGLGQRHERITFEMLSWIWKTRNKSNQTRQFVLETGRPHIFCRDSKQLRTLYRAWHLHPPTNKKKAAQRPPF